MLWQVFRTLIRQECELNLHSVYWYCELLVGVNLWAAMLRQADITHEDYKVDFEPDDKGYVLREAERNRLM